MTAAALVLNRSIHGSIPEVVLPNFCQSIPSREGYMTDLKRATPTSIISINMGRTANPSIALDSPHRALSIGNNPEAIRPNFVRSTPALGGVHGIFHIVQIAWFSHRWKEESELYPMGPLAQSKSDQLTRYHQLKIRRQLDHGWNRNQILRLTVAAPVHAIIFIVDAIIISNSQLDAN